VPRALRAEELRLLAEDRGDVDALLDEVEPALLDPLDGEEVVEQRSEAAALRVDDLEVVAARVGVDVARRC
jgi:hypothetical protein